MPTTGNVKILALLIDFTDYPHYNSSRDHPLQALRRGVDAGRLPLREPAQLLQRSSYDQLDLQRQRAGLVPAGLLARPPGEPQRHRA